MRGRGTVASYLISSGAATEARRPQAAAAVFSYISAHAPRYSCRQRRLSFLASRLLPVFWYGRRTRRPYFAGSADRRRGGRRRRAGGGNQTTKDNNHRQKQAQKWTHPMHER